jgi:hypothetical protein
MKKLMFGVMGMAAMAVAFAPTVSAKPTTVKGELIDTTCGKDGKTGKSGVEHASCATSCAKRGEPVAVYTADGGVYLVTGAFAADKNAKLIEYMAKVVEVTGEVTKDKDGKLSIAAEKVTVAK